MQLLGWIFALPLLVVVNYWAGRSGRATAGRLTLVTTSLPALLLVGFTSWRLGYAILNADEVNRRFQEGDLTYFGADMAFGVSLVLGGVWVLSAFLGFLWGRRSQSQT